MKSAIFALFILIGLQAVGQVPNHFKLGEKQFGNTDIYNIYVSPENDIYAATSNGVFVYQKNNFTLLPRNAKQKGNSFFDFKQDLESNLYVKNLKGQIFKIQNDSLKVVYEAKESEGITHFNYFFNLKNELCIFDKDFFKINKNGEKKIIYQTAISQSTGLKVQINRPSIFGNNFAYFECFDATGKKLAFIYQNDSITPFDFTKVVWKNNVEPSLRTAIYYFNIKNTPLFLSGNKVIGSTIADLNYSISSNIQERYENLPDGRIIGQDNTSGLRVIDLVDGTISASPKLFPNTFISTCYTATDSTVYLGTFGGGIIVVPNIDAVKIESDRLYTSCAATNDYSIFLSARGGSIYRYNNELAKVDQRSDNVERLVSLAKPIVSVEGKNTTILTSVLQDNGTAKDFYESNNGCWLASNGGISFIPYENDTASIPKFLVRKKVGQQYRGVLKYVINDVQESFTTVAFQASTNTLYAANYKGLYYSKNNQLNKHDIITDSIQASDIEINNSTVIVSTQNHGIYWLNNGSIVNQLTTQDGLLSNRIIKIEKDGNLLYILSDKGFQVLNLNSLKLKNLGMQEGVNNTPISDFDFNNTHLLFLEKDGFYWVSKRKIHDKDIIQPFAVDSILMNGKQVDTSTMKTFSYQDNEFKLSIHFSDYIKAQEAYYTYQLVGFDKNENVMVPTTNEIFYQSLPPGNYHFKLALHYRQNQPQIFSYQFEILPPFWQRWWFILLVLIGIILIFYVILRQKLKVQAKKSAMINELNTAKLAAIQSQMNPHFIFNALNSIQHLVIEGDSKQAYNYITQFSNLVRKTLDYSEKESISLVQEIELITIYLKLESLRFGEDFEYSINQKDIQDIDVPPMLIQPFIENAIVHGLLHKRGTKILKIDLEIKEGILYCEVKDNGIGRDESRK